MADGDFRLITAAGTTIDLNALKNGSASGVQATAGLTGFGLPSVDVQFQTGAGDGATYRGQRVSPKAIDIPLFIYGSTKANLRAQVDGIARAFADYCYLQWEDGTTVWQLKVRRTGGGDFTYGSTDGADPNNLTVTTTITVQSEVPYWESTAAVSLSSTGGDQTGGQAANGFYSLSAAGNAPAAPSVKIQGPSLGFDTAVAYKTSRATSPNSSANLALWTKTNGTITWDSATSSSKMVLASKAANAAVPFAARMYSDQKACTPGEILAVTADIQCPAGASNLNLGTMLELLFFDATGARLNPSAAAEARLADSWYHANRYYMSGFATVPSNAATFAVQVSVQAYANSYAYTAAGEYVLVYGIECRALVPNTLLAYSTLLGPDKAVTVDMSKATAVDQSGNTAYQGLVAGPRFPAYDPQSYDLYVATDRTSINYYNATHIVYTNYVTNPTFTTNATGWVLNQNAAPAGTLAYDSAAQGITCGIASLGSSSSNNPTITINVTGLTASTAYDFVTQVVASGSLPPYYSGGYGGSISVYDGNFSSGTLLVSTPWNDRSSSRVSFTTATTQVFIVIRASAARSKPPYVYVTNGFTLQNAGVFPQGQGYFDGTTTSTTSNTYAWTGTANASTSTNSFNVAAPTITPGCTITLKGRSWVVV